MSMTSEQRRAMFAKQKGKRWSFPLRGRGGRAQRNRGTLYGVGSLAVSGVALAAALRGRHGLRRALWPSFVYTPKFTSQAATVMKRGVKRHVKVFTPSATGAMAKGFASSRPARDAETWLQHAPIARHIVKSNRSLGAAGVDASGFIGRAQTRYVNRPLRKMIANKADRFSLYNFFGGPGKAYPALVKKKEAVKTVTSRKVRRTLERSLLGSTVKRVEGPRLGYGLQGPGRPKVVRVPSRVERFVSKPFAATARKVRQADIYLTRSLRTWIRKQRKSPRPS